MCAGTTTPGSEVASQAVGAWPATIEEFNEDRSYCGELGEDCFATIEELNKSKFYREGPAAVLWSVPGSSAAGPQAVRRDLAGREAAAAGPHGGWT